MTTGTAALAARVAAHPFGAGLAPDHLRALCAAATAVSYPAGARIFAEGGAADRFWLLDRGAVALGVYVPGRGDTVVETLPAGTVLGWSWLDPPYRWHFGAAAVRPVGAVVVDAGPVRRRCDADPAFGYAMLRRFTPVLAARLHATRLRLLDLYAAPAGAGPS